MAVAAVSAVWPPLIWGAAVSSLWGAPPAALVDALKAHKARLPELLATKLDNLE